MLQLIIIIVLIISIISLLLYYKRKLEEANKYLESVKHSLERKSLDLERKSLEMAKLDSQMIDLKRTIKNQEMLSEKSKKGSLPRVLSMKPCEPALSTGEIEFYNTVQKLNVTNGSVTVTILNNRLSKVYISTRENKKYIKIPVIIKVKK